MAESSASALRTFFSAVSASSFSDDEVCPSVSLFGNMVSTRNHPSNFPLPDLSPIKTSPSKSSPSKRSARASTAAKEDSPDDSFALTRPGARSITTTWSHTPSQLTLLWMLISLPLVIWDTFYMLGRPYTMPGGKWHLPLWKPYALYGSVDYVYGWPHYENKEGFGPAQGLCNAVETALYLTYVYIAFRYGREESTAGRGAPANKLSFGRRKIVGKEAGLAVLIAFATAIATFWKTVLYWLIEFYNGYQNIGHNPLGRLVLLWIFPNGAWLVGAGYMIYVTGSEILQGLEVATGLPHEKEV